MSTASLEHINVTVSDPQKTAQLLCELFDWKIRWQGEAKLGGYTVHVGSGDSYLAVYAYPPRHADERIDYTGLNHIGVLVEDLEAVEQRVLDHGFRIHNYGEYEPGRRFYFDDEDGIEFEVVSYNAA